MTDAPSQPCILVVEDEPMVGMLLEDLLDASGYRVLLAEELAGGLALARAESVNAAILDVTLGRDDSFPLADELSRSGIPFLFASGYGGEGIPQRFGDVPTLQKPYDMKALKAALATLLDTCQDTPR
jgi:DNA-binding response OmpR family regulator